MRRTSSLRSIHAFAFACAVGCGDDDGAREGSRSDASAEVDGGGIDASLGRDGGSGDAAHVADLDAERDLDAEEPAASDSGMPGQEAGARFSCAVPALPVVGNSRLFFASGPGRTFGLSSSALLTATRAYPRVGWALWSLANGSIVSASGSAHANVGEGVVAMGADSFLVSNYERPGRGYVWRSLANGEPNVPRFGSAYPAEYPAPGGIAADGTYAFVYDGSLYVSTRDGSTWQPTATVDFISNGFFAASEALYAVSGDATTTTLHRFPRGAAQATTIGPLAGRFVDWFEDGTRFVTRAPAGFLRVYTREGQRVATLQDEKFAQGDLYRLRDEEELPVALFRAGGRGDSFWVRVPQSPGARLHVFSVADPAIESYTTSFVSREQRTDVGVAVPVTESTWQHVILTGATPRIESHSREFSEPATLSRATSSLGRNAETWELTPRAGSPSAEFTQLDGLEPKLGCGVIRSHGANARWFIVSTSLGGTFVYSPALEQPSIRLAEAATAVLLPRTGNAFALVTDDNTVSVFDETGARTFTHTQQEKVTYSLSPDGSLVGLAWSTAAEDAGTGSIGHWRARRVSDGATVFELDLAGVSPTALRISPDNGGFAVGARIYRGAQLVGTFEGIVDWIDDMRMFTSSQIISTEGLPQGAFSCPQTAAVRQWTGPSAYYAEGQSCNLSTGAATATPTDPVVPDPSSPFPPTPARELYRFEQWRVFAAAYSFYKLPPAR